MLQGSTQLDTMSSPLGICQSSISGHLVPVTSVPSPTAVCIVHYAYN